MRTVIFTLCILLGFAFAGTVSADKKGGGKGGGKGAHASGGGGKGGGGGHAGGMGQHAGGGMHQGHANGMHQGGQGNGHGQHGLNANHAGGGHGLNAHNGLHGAHTGNALAHHGGNAQFAHNRFGANHWRNGAHWHASHAVFAGYHRAWHDRYWWHGHYDRVAFVGGPYWGGYWYWDGGYWFPAWGYEPAYVGYLYDGPIYAYSNLPPDQVVVNVQEILQDQGYYTGDVDGQLGTQTRDALASYQRDHDLEVTSSIDEPTVQSLGLNNEQA